MNPAGELRIELLRRAGGLHCEIVSTRPLTAARLFAGKPVDEVLQTLPLLFNVCARAQAASLVRAIESAALVEVDEATASQRQAVVSIESLREQSLRILMDWPTLCGDDGEKRRQDIAALVQASVRLAHMLAPQRLFAVGGTGLRLGDTHRRQWMLLRERIEQALFGMPVAQWQRRHGKSKLALRGWAAERKTVAARFLSWLSIQPWRHAGVSAVKPLPALDDAVLAHRLRADGERFTARPDWRGACVDMSWFGGIERRPLLQTLLRENGNGIHTRCVGRLLSIAQTVEMLDGFFLRNARLQPPASQVPGMAHIEAARGRLTHLVELDGERIGRLLILAPTEWNFHPRGVAATALENLHGDDEAVLKKQAGLLIHAIDPCVGYTLNIGDATLRQAG